MSNKKKILAVLLAALVLVAAVVVAVTVTRPAETPAEAPAYGGGSRGPLVNTQALMAAPEWADAEGGVRR